MAKLITGGTGYVGSELAHLLVERGEEVVLFDVQINRNRIEDIQNEIKIVQGDLGNQSEVLNVVKDNHITEIYHLGAKLTFTSESNPWASFQSNVIGTYNVLEAARLFNVRKMMYTSTFGTFGLQMEEVCTDLSIQRPLTMYGCGKLYGEGLGRFYRNKFGLDFRSIRYALMIGPNVRTPGHWVPAMVEDSILGKPHEAIYALPESRASLIYVKDAALAADMVLQAPRENIKMVNYNVAGIPETVTAKNIEDALKKRYPGTRITYNDEHMLPALRAHNVMKVFDDSYARKEWGWNPEYKTLESIIEAFEKDLKGNPKRYGLV
jgi:threonine 3-dehydrogenase